jgi:putative PIN family toxin of toxin-antitoxin system
MLVLLDSSIFISALISPYGKSATVYNEWLANRFRVVPCQQQIDEIRIATRHPRFKGRLQPHHIGTMLNNLYGAFIWEPAPPRKHDAADPTDSYLLDLIDAAQPEFAVTGDKRSGLLQLGSLGRTKILSTAEFCEKVLHL